MGLHLLRAVNKITGRASGRILLRLISDFAYLISLTEVNPHYSYQTPKSDRFKIFESSRNL